MPVHGLQIHPSCALIVAHPLRCLDSITVGVTYNYRMTISDGASLKANIARLAFPSP